MKKKRAGRPELPEGEKKWPVTIRLPINIINYMIDNKDKEGSQAVMIEKAMIKTYDIENPGSKK